MLEDNEIDWGSVQTGLILGSFFYGYIVTQIIGGVAIAFLPDYLVNHQNIIISTNIITH